jgi:Replication-relaxation
MTAAPPVRVRSGHVQWVADRLSARDWAIIETVNRLGLISGVQLERCLFADLAEGRSRTVSRSRTLARLVRWRVLLPLPRRVGGPRQGSSVTVFALDTAGVRLLRQRSGMDNAGRIRRPGIPGERFVRHACATAEIFTSLTEADRAGALILRGFQTEPRWPDGLGGSLNPDAFVVVSNGRVDHLWWIEVDMATESLPTIRRKLRTYLDFLARGGRGPRGVMPRILAAVPDHSRVVAVRAEVTTLPPPATDLMHVIRQSELATWLVQKLPP